MLCAIYQNSRHFHVKYCLAFSFTMSSDKSLPENFQVPYPKIARHSSNEYTILWKILKPIETFDKGKRETWGYFWANFKLYNMCFNQLRCWISVFSQMKPAKLFKTKQSDPIWKLHETNFMNESIVQNWHLHLSSYYS